MDNVSITPHELDPSYLIKYTFSIVIPAICGSPLLKGERLRFCRKDRDRELEECGLVQWNVI